MSIRRVADELGVGAMTLYRYVPGKAELIDVMLDTVYGELPLREVDGDWRAKLDEVARESREMYLKHPWLLQVAVSRPPLGPGVMAKYEYELSAVEGIGLTDVEMDAAVALVNGYVHGAVRSAVEAASGDPAFWDHRQGVVASARAVARARSATRRSFRCPAGSGRRSARSSTRRTTPVTVSSSGWPGCWTESRRCSKIGQESCE